MKLAFIVILTIIFATQCSADFVDTLLEAQNAYRTVLNVAPLTWSADLAESAQQWANHLADIGKLVHSSSKNGENLAYITGTYTGDLSSATSDSSEENNNGSTGNSSTDNTNTANTSNENSSDAGSNSENGDNNSGSSNTGFLSTQPTTSNQPQATNGQNPVQSTQEAPKTRWSKTKNDHYGAVNTYTNDGGNSDGRRLSNGGRRLSESDAGDSDLVRLVGLWGAEKQYFVYGSFPDVSNTGDWSDVGHYTQLVWANTKQVGCGIANGNGNEYLVCQYYPSGNWDGETVY